MMRQNYSQARKEFKKANELHMQENGQYDPHVLINEMACGMFILMKLLPY